MALSTSFMVGYVVVCFLTSAVVGVLGTGTALTPDETITPEWRTDLRPAVGPDPVRLIVGNRPEIQGKPQSSLWFIDNNKVVATFVTRENEARPAVSRRNSLDSSLPLRLRAILLDANTGLIAATVTWPTESRGSRIVGVHDGKFVTLRGSELTLYAGDFSALRETRLPPLLGPLGWLPHASPTGKNILFSSAELRKGSWIWVETDTLKTLSSWEDIPSGILTISDENIATSTCWWGQECRSTIVTANDASACIAVGPKCEPKIQIRGLSTDWKTIAVGEMYLGPQFVNDDLIFLPGNTIKVIRTDGTVLFEETRGRGSWGCWGSRALSSADGRRFVIPSCQVKGASATLDIGGHSVLSQFLIFDVSPQIRMQALDVKGAKIQDDIDFAISPDGSKIAILSNEFVQVFQLPGVTGNTP